LEKDEAAVKTALQGLGDWSLLFLDAKSGTFDVHRLTRTWMSQNVTPAEKIKEWALAAGEYFKVNTTSYEEAELCISYFEIAEAWTDFAEVSFRLQGHYQLIGFYQRAFELNQAVLAKNIDAKTNARALNNIGQIYKVKGDYDTALRYWEQSLAIYQELGDRQGEGTTLNNISQIYQAKGDYNTALRYLEQSLGIVQEIGDRQGEGTTLNNIGLIYHSKDDYDTALGYYEKSLGISQEIGDRRGEGSTLNNISQIYQARGDYDTALRYLEQSLGIGQEIGDIAGLATTLNNMGAMLFEQERFEEAIPLLVQAYQILQQIGSPDAEGTASYLNAIMEHIGEIKYKAIISKIG